jgi:uncharacterized protein with HEPN domain
MAEAATKAVGFLEGRSRRDLDRDEMLGLAIVRLIEVVGEATRALSAEWRRAHPQVPWRDIIGTRDRLIHGYHDVDLDLVWAIASQDLPHLVGQLRSMLDAEGAGGLAGTG